MYVRTWTKRFQFNKLFWMGPSNDKSFSWCSCVDQQTQYKIERFGAELSNCARVCAHGQDEVVSGQSVAGVDIEFRSHMIMEKSKNYENMFSSPGKVHILIFC